jgi:SAM-dependent methyltransferase
MLIDEAKRIGNWIDDLGDGAGRVCLNIGSSTEEFRKRVQPFIHEFVIGRLEQRGWRVVNCDMKAADGVDEVGDLMEPDFRASLRRYDADLLLCSNLLEHVTSPPDLIAACADIVSPGGYCLITVPRSYPYHPDPLDTMYRPSPTELAQLLPSWSVVRAEEISCGGLIDELAQSENGFAALLRRAARAALPFYKRKEWYPAAHSLLWLVRDYRVSATLLRKPAAAA